MINAIRKLIAPTVPGPSIEQAIEYFYTVDTVGGVHTSAETVREFFGDAFEELVRIEFYNQDGRYSMDVWLEPLLDGACYGEW